MRRMAGAGWLRQPVQEESQRRQGTDLVLATLPNPHREGVIRLMALHMFTARKQPASRVFKGRVLILADCCRRRRWVKYCNVQVYYDCCVVTCKPGRGCNRG